MTQPCPIKARLPRGAHTPPLASPTAPMDLGAPCQAQAWTHTAPALHPLTHQEAQVPSPPSHSPGALRCHPHPLPHQEARGAILHPLSHQEAQVPSCTLSLTRSPQVPFPPSHSPGSPRCHSATSLSPGAPRCCPHPLSHQEARGAIPTLSLTRSPQVPSPPSHSPGSLRCYPAGSARGR